MAIEITDRDYHLLKFLWKWKCVSTMALARKHFPTLLPSSAYRRLQFLEAGGYIKSFIVEGRKQEVWTISHQGFQHIQPKLGELASIGYKSENCYHDYLVTAFHLGEWLTQQPVGTQDYSEQQLRRYHVSTWPAWIPDSETHRPDGFSAFNKGEEIVVAAFEVELSAKNRYRYESVVAYYDANDEIDLVFWLVDRKPTLNALRKSFEKFGMRRTDKHHFLLLENFKTQGWMTPLIGGRFSGKSLSEILPTEKIALPSKYHRGYDVSSLLNTARRVINPIGHKSTPRTKKS